MTAEHEKNLWLYTINAVDESSEIGIFGKTPLNNIVPNDVNIEEK